MPIHMQHFEQSVGIDCQLQRMNKSRLSAARKIGWVKDALHDKSPWMIFFMVARDPYDL
ncbi:hypothetical protein RE6C_02811 [Rhodopirellula europaea 6C]|uniref:Uncharacterized protein n=1 Tax=Rhodopirellula europaea 6C TaxID=1263867 RepID=M2A6K3_9BACT|nr:hypothetical protein RE6C_02811 [Rhodopirellula europaea 6C]